MFFSGATYDAEQGSSRAGDHRAQQKALHRVELVPTNRTGNGQHYRVSYAGKILVEGRRPIFETCRDLHARGITGRLEIWRPGKTSADLQLDIERGAKFAIKETETESLKLVPWKPRPESILYAAWRPLAAKLMSSVE